MEEVTQYLKYNTLEVREDIVEMVAGEEKTGKGYADFTFRPRRKNDTAFIVELKKDELPDVALGQIKEKEYAQKMLKEHERILAVAICYDSKGKEHQCKIEEMKKTILSMSKIYE